MRRHWLAAVVAASTVPVAVLATGVPANADITVDSAVCVSTATGSMSFAATTLEWLSSTQVTWTSNVAGISACSGAGGSLRLLEGVGVDDRPQSLPVAGSGSTTVTPLRTIGWVLRLTTLTGQSKDLASVPVTVDLPQLPPLPNGQANVTITGSSADQRRLFVQAVGTPRATVTIAGGVDLDLSGQHDILVAPGVRIIGDRSAVPAGPRLFTTTYPRRLLSIGGTGDTPPSDNVRISGVRLDGGQGDESAGDDTLGSTGVSVFSSVGVEIDDNEVYGWRGTGIFVDDERGNISLGNNPNAVRIHDNFIHHNQHYREEGYGIAVHLGAYALIEQNVFDYNRHAIEGDGRTGSGYLAERNLFLTNGGDNTGLTSTHMLDMHGTESCWGFTAYCGQAGEYMGIRNNTILYDDGTGFRLRGRPTIRADVTANVFAHSQVWSGVVPFVDDGALSQTVDGDDIKEQANTFGLNRMGSTGSCDFDGDGTADRFAATGVTWWYASSRRGGRWVYLNTSDKRLADLRLADVDHDGRCDVSTGGVIFSGGATPLHTNLLWHVANATPFPASTVWKLDTGGAAATTRDPGNLLYGELLGSGDFDADGDSDILARQSDGSLTLQLLDDDALTGNEFGEGQAPAGSTFAGIGDFDGDRYDDVLWRLADGHFEIWSAGRSIRRAPIDLAAVDPRWQVRSTGDFNGDGYDDILFHNTNGAITIWHMQGSKLLSHTASNTMDPSGALDPAGVWQIAGVGDVNGDGYDDILWRKDDGSLTVWFKGTATGAATVSYQNSGAAVDAAWHVIGVGDANGDGREDIFWRHSATASSSGAAGQVAVWLLDGGRFIGDRYPGVANEATTLVALLPATKGVKVRPVITSPGNRSSALGSPVGLTLSASGGTAPYTWAVAGLPAGMTGNAAGTISGTPTATGTRTVTATVTDAAGQSDTVSFTWTVTVVVPDVLGMTLPQARTALTGAGLTVGTVGSITVWDSSDGGKVMNQSLPGGGPAAVGTPVNLTLGLWGGANR